ncbi:MAG TPA: hypothetical protein VHB20_15235 [Verrucomicrobiae bacterium]|jgi:hypothetical protein|nr:hypothetical protein [Verrucomicrobiae bacterium]
MDRYTQMAQVRAAERRRVLEELNQLAADIRRCEETIALVMAELNAVNAKYQGPRTTRQDVEYLTVLLECAKRKLAWEKQIASLHKRAPELLAGMMKILNDQDFPPSDEVKAEMLQALQVVQAALERLQPTEPPASPAS